MSFGIGLAQGLAGALNGYVRGTQYNDEKARQEKADARAERLEQMQTEQFGWARDAAASAQRDRANKEALDKAVTEGMEVGSPKSAAAVTYTDADGTKRTAYQPDMAAAQAAAETQRLEEALSPGLTPSAPQAQPAMAVRTLSGGRGLYVGPTASDDAAKFAAENPSSDYDKYMALSKRLAAMAGGQEKADAYLKRAKEAEKEGAFRALTLLDAGDPDGAVKAWNSTGARRLEPGQRLVTVTDKQGGKIHQVVNADGSLAVPDVEKSLVRYLSGIEGITSEVKARNDARAKFSEEVYKPRVLKPGETFGAINPTTGQWQQFGVGSIPAGFQPVERNGETVLERIPGAAGAGKGGKAPATPLDATRAILADLAEKGEVKYTPDQRADAENYAERLLAADPRLPPARAARAAHVAATKPERSAPAFNPDTGSIDITIRDDDGAVYTLTPNAISAADIGTDAFKKRFPNVDLKKSVVDMAAKQGKTPDEVKLFQAAAFDPAARQKLLATAKEQADQQLAEVLKQNAASPSPAPEAAIRARAAELLAQHTANTERKLDLFKRFGEPPKSEKKAPADTAPGARKTGGFGLDQSAPADSPAGRFQARQAGLRASREAADAASAAKRAELSAQFKADAKTMDPVELSRKYDSLRMSLPSEDAASLQLIERQIR